MKHHAGQIALPGGKIEKGESEVIAILQNGTEIKAEQILIGIGRKLNSDGIGLENIGLNIEKGKIPVNEKMQTSIPNIYAIGDVVGKVLLAHVASKQGLVAIENIMGNDAIMNYDVIPSCTYTFPEVASVGLKEKDLKEREIPYNIGRYNFLGSAKAHSIGEADGFVKVLVHKENHKLLGVQMIGPHTTDLISEAALALNNNLSAEQIADTIHAHPTLAEVFYEAVEDAIGMGIHTI